MKKTKSKSKRYFTQETEDAIIQYNKTSSAAEKNKIYNEHIQYPFEKLAENIYHTFSSSTPYLETDIEDSKSDIVSVLIEKMHMFKEGKGKAFSYFTVIGRNHLTHLNIKGYKKVKKLTNLSSMPEGWDMENDFDGIELNDDYQELKEIILKFWNENLTAVFIKKKEMQIADAILELLRRSDHIENFNKKYIYLLIREMTDVKSHHITKVIKIMKEHNDKIMNSYFEYGDHYDEIESEWGFY